MGAALGSYSQYRDTGVALLGEIPVHWDVRQLGRFGRFSKGNGGTKDDEVADGVPCIRYGDIYGQHQFFARKSRACVSAERARDYTPIRYGDVLFAGSGETIEEIGKSVVNLIPTDACCGGDVILFRPSEELNARFMGYACDCQQTALQKSRMGRGITVMHLYEGQLKYVWLALPPMPEQAAIGRFLDDANRRIGQRMRAKQKLIKLLEEQRQAIVHRAVTCGLDASAAVEPSRIPWLGDIPRHWEVRRAKYLFREVDERSIDGSEELLSVSHLTGVTPRSQKNITMFKAASYVGHKLCRPDDLVVNTMWAWAGALGVSKHSGIISPAYAVYRPHRPEESIGAYTESLLRTRTYISNIICHSTGLQPSRLRLYPDEFLRLPIVQPPAEEQREIVRFIHSHTADLNRAASQLEREMILLSEYSTRLVADVVTGKLDVREAAAGLSDDAGGQELVDDEEVCVERAEVDDIAEIEGDLEEVEA